MSPDGGGSAPTNRMIPFDILVIALGSAAVFSLPANRRTPTIVFVASLAGLLLAANLLPDPALVLYAKLIVIATYLVGLIGFPHRLAGIARADVAFDGLLRSIQRPVSKSQEKWVRAWDAA